ncbi:asparagine synthase C-terminal domain-containing protein, partial [Omnitrophica bacterium]|nr:asparagine synthase C-terminal domain-containing protein [Candidatus Omnitrophota bacterium]
YLVNIIDSSDAADPVEKVINADIMSILPEDYIVKAERANMASSLEARSPFLDHKVMEFAASLPIEYKLKGLIGAKRKYILRKTFKDKIPDSVLNRHKRGFTMPVGEWFRKELKDFIRDVLLDKRSSERDLFSRDYLERLLDEHQGGRNDHVHKLWSILSFEMWHRIFIEKSSI